MGKTKKLPGWKPGGLPDPEMCARLREYILKIVFQRWNNEKKPSTHTQIYNEVTERIEQEWNTYVWSHKWGKPLRTTVIRRVAECADPDFYKDGIPKLAAKTNGLYQPNPALLGLIKPIKLRIEEKKVKQLCLLVNTVPH